MCLFRPLAGVHPELPARAVQREAFERIWRHSVALLQRGFKQGSILTVDPEEAAALGDPKLRRCARQGGPLPACALTLECRQVQIWILPMTAPCPGSFLSTAARWVCPMTPAYAVCHRADIAAYFQ